jgi:uncharacterized protein (TIGR02271 family)
MSSSDLPTVYGKHSRIGVIDSRSLPAEESQTHILVRLDNDQQIWVPAGLLQRQSDGSYSLPFTLAQLNWARAASQEGAQLTGQSAPVLVLPVIEEQLDVSVHQKTSGVRLTKQVQEREELVDEPTIVEELEVERVPRNQVLDGPVSVRQEEDTLIVPLVEEVLVLEKRMVLREEVHITKKRRHVRSPQRVILRREEVLVERSEDQQDELEG